MKIKVMISYPCSCTFPGARVFVCLFLLLKKISVSHSLILILQFFLNHFVFTQTFHLEELCVRGTKAFSQNKLLIQLNEKDIFRNWSGRNPDFLIFFKNGFT